MAGVGGKAERRREGWGVRQKYRGGVGGKAARWRGVRGRWGVRGRGRETGRLKSGRWGEAEEGRGGG